MAITAPVPAGLPLQDITVEDIPLHPAVPAHLLRVVASEASEAGLLEAAVLPAAGEFACLFGIYFPAHQSCTPGTCTLEPARAMASPSPEGRDLGWG